MRGMSWVWQVAMVLGMIYAAALILALRDRLSPPAPYSDEVPRLLAAVATKGVLPRLCYFMILPPVWAFALVMWLIVYGPVLLWRRLIG
jgi:hypothetical protein